MNKNEKYSPKDILIKDFEKLREYNADILVYFIGKDSGEYDMYKLMSSMDHKDMARIKHAAENIDKIIDEAIDFLKSGASVPLELPELNHEDIRNEAHKYIEFLKDEGVSLDSYGTAESIISIFRLIAGIHVTNLNITRQFDTEKLLKDFSKWYQHEDYEDIEYAIQEYLNILADNPIH